MKLNNNDDSHNSGLNLLIYNMLLDIESHPAWVCGLKPYQAVKLLWSLRSHPAWVCGLKLKKSAVLKIASPSHPAWVCGLKLYAGLPERFEIQPGHTLRGCVDWNGKPAEALYYFMGHTLRGCVDWNWKHTVRFSTILVTPCVGVWIETAMRKKYAKKQLSHPAWVCGLKRWNTWS